MFKEALSKKLEARLKEQKWLADILKDKLQLEIIVSPELKGQRLDNSFSKTWKVLGAIEE